LDADHAEKVAVEYLKKKKPNSSIMIEGVEANRLHISRKVAFYKVHGTLKDEQETLHDFWVQINIKGIVEGWSVTEKGTSGKPILKSG
jgi:hypothetical protein